MNAKNVKNAHNAKKVATPARLPVRRRDAHKGEFGRVLVLGGSRGMIGAPALAVNAALRAGAGLVTAAVPENIQPFVATLCPCATSIPLSCDEAGCLSAGAVREMLDAVKLCDVLAVGPGLGVGIAQENIVRAVIGQEKPLVLDADGLNNLARIDDWPSLRRCPLVLTPHAGEFTRLTGKSIEQVQSDREASALAAVQQWSRGTGVSPVVVLKGAGTVVAAAGSVFVNDTGNPGMATGGSGDVLTGLLAGLIGQGMAPFEAACLAVNVHGRAGDIAAGATGEASLIAADLLDHVAEALQEQAD